MTQVMDQECTALRSALAEFADISQKIAPLLREYEDKKQVVIGALGTVIIQFVEKHGTIERSEDKTCYRMLSCTKIAEMPGFQELITTMFGEIDWEQLYRPALNHLDRTKASFIFGMGDCFVVLAEELTSAEVKAIRRSRRAR